MGNWLSGTPSSLPQSADTISKLCCETDKSWVVRVGRMLLHLVISLHFVQLLYHLNFKMNFGFCFSLFDGQNTNLVLQKKEILLKIR